MKVEDIEIHTGKPDFEYTPVRQLEVKCEATNALMPAPTIEEANGRLRALAAKVGANAIVDVTYNSGVSFTSWKSLKAAGLAVQRQSEDRTCPFCAETIKRAAVVCKHCGRELVDHPPAPVAVAPAAATSGAVPAHQEPLRENNNPVLIIAACAIGLFLLMLFVAAAGQ